MIALIGSMLRARLVQAVIVALLGTVTIGVAVAVPAFIAAGDNSVIAGELAHAPATQRDMHATTSFKLGGNAAQPDGTFARNVPADFALPGFDVTFSASTDVSVTGKTYAYPRLQFRQNQCDHIVIVVGRCAESTGEVMVNSDLARQEGLSAGGSTVISYAVYTAGDGWKVLPATKPLTVTVVGVYDARDKTEPYWGQDLLFLNQIERASDAPILTTPGTIRAIDHSEEEQSVDAVLIPSAITSARLQTLGALVGTRVTRAQGYSQVIAGSDIQSLVKVIQQDQATLRETVPILAVPLIALGCFVVFLAGGYAVSGRREELGVVALRGAPWRPRWLLGTGESLVALAVAVPCGYVVGYLAARLAARFVLPGRPAVSTFGHGAQTYVLITVAACVIAILAAAYRTLRTPTSELLRNVPPRSSAWRSAAVELLVVALAAVGVVQMRGEHKNLTGIELVAPGLAIAAIAVLAARLVTPLAGAIGRRSLWSRRRIGFGIGALQISRRPGAARVFVLLVVAVGLVTFGAAGSSVASTERGDRAEQELGAPKVVSVEPVSRLTLLNAVRKVDPSGAYAMAVAWVPQKSPQEPPILAVDSSRLAAVAAWPAGSPTSAAQAARLLRQPASAPITFTGETVTIDMTLTSHALPALHPHLKADVESLTTGQINELDFGAVHNGRFTYTSISSACAAGCRLADINLIAIPYENDTVTFTLHSMRVLEPEPATVTTFGSTAPWHGVHGILDGGTVPIASGADGLVITPPATPTGVQFYLMASDTAYPVLALSTKPLTHSLQGQLGQQDIPVALRQVGTLPVLPRLADNGILVDLQNVDRAAQAIDDEATTPQVWLSASAPPDVVSRLESAGLVVSGSSSIVAERSYFGRRGPAVGVLFFWIVVAAVLLLMVGGVVLTASVDRIRRGAELRALRVQGLPAGRIRGAALFGHAGLAVVALIVGVIAGLASWWLTGVRVPMFADGFALVDAPVWPAWSGVAWVLSAVAIVLLVVSYAAAWDLRRVVRRTAQSALGVAPQRGGLVQQRDSADSVVGSSR